MQDEDFFLSAAELASRIRRREVSPVELVDALFERIARIDTQLHAYCTLAPDQARLAARTAEADLLHGKPVGPLHGVPVCVKDNLETAGIRTTYGSRLFEQFIPAEDAVAVARLKKAGAIVMGKTSLPEFAAKSVTDPPLFGHTRNPWATDRVAGGSSGGTAAAIAAGLAPAGLGNDAAGSIRIPAACCGIAGLKPSAGRVPQYPSANPWEIASQTGPMARAVGDLDLLLRSMAGPDERDPLSLPALPGEESTSLEELVRPWRIAWSPDLGFARVDPEVLEVASDAVQDLSSAGTV